MSCYWRRQPLAAGCSAAGDVLSRVLTGLHSTRTVWTRLDLHLGQHLAAAPHMLPGWALLRALLRDALEVSAERRVPALEAAHRASLGQSLVHECLERGKLQGQVTLSAV